VIDYFFLGFEGRGGRWRRINFKRTERREERREDRVKERLEGEKERGEERWKRGEEEDWKRKRAIRREVPAKQKQNGGVLGRKRTKRKEAKGKSRE